MLPQDKAVADMGPVERALDLLAKGCVGVAGTGLVVLVAILLVAKSRLVASGAVEIAINDDPDHTLTAYGGGTLLGQVQSRGRAINRQSRPGPLRQSRQCKTTNVRKDIEHSCAFQIR